MLKFKFVQTEKFNTLINDLTLSHQKITSLTRENEKLVEENRLLEEKYKNFVSKYKNDNVESKKKWLNGYPDE